MKIEDYTPVQRAAAAAVDAAHYGVAHVDYGGVRGVLRVVAGDYLWTPDRGATMILDDPVIYLAGLWEGVSRG